MRPPLGACFRTCYRKRLPKNLQFLLCSSLNVNRQLAFCVLVLSFSCGMDRDNASFLLHGTSARGRRRKKKPLFPLSASSGLLGILTRELHGLVTFRSPSSQRHSH